MKLRWEEQRDGAWYCFRGAVQIGMLVRRYANSRWVWNISGVNTKWYGGASEREYGSMAGARRALERVWVKWCTAAEIEP